MNENESKVNQLINRMNEIQTRIFGGCDVGRDERSEFSKCADIIQRTYGYVIRKKAVKNSSGRKIGCIWRTIPECEAVKRNRHFSAGWEKIDMRPNDGLPTCLGDCTTRAMSFCLKGRFTYREIEKRQYRIAEMKNQERGLHWGDGRKKSHRNSFGVWDIIMKDLGYIWICLDRKTRRDNLAVSLMSIEYPIITHSSGHVAVVNEGSVIDSWDSRHGRCDRILVKGEDTRKIIDILKKSWIKSHILF